jgi:hypothetical protein
MEGTPETGVVDRRRLEEELRRLEAELAVPERDAAGEVSDVDQHQADQATETFDREWALGRIEDLRARLAAGGPTGRVVRPGVETYPSAPDDDTTPLDEPAERAPDLASLPRAEAHAAQTTQDLDAPGELYEHGRTLPDVGEAEPGDDALEGSYRPD